MAKKKNNEVLVNTTIEKVEEDNKKTINTENVTRSNSNGSLLSKIIPAGIVCLLMMLSFVLGTRYTANKNNTAVNQSPISNNSNNSQNQTSTMFNQNTDNFISEDKAKEIALNAAGLKESDVKGMRTHLDYDDGFYHYDVSFIANEKDYEYEMNPENGEIIGYEIESIYD